ncbi:hypothetical protein SLA2020_420990 [Shorea laevis]
MDWTDTCATRVARGSMCRSPLAHEHAWTKCAVVLTSTWRIEAEHGSQGRCVDDGQKLHEARALLDWAEIAQIHRSRAGE